MKKLTVPIKSLFLVVLFFLAIAGQSCQSSTERLIGTYVMQNHHHTMDTLWLEKTGNYRRILRSASGEKLIFEHKGTWDSEGDKIILQNYTLELDAKHGNIPLAQENNSTILPISIRKGKKCIDVYQDLNFFYLKID